ncbi:PqqD family peptide modification chaperone, partial [candidate division WWE3 bacterium]|nr:PqqD family peptide modification chaperone [candidate division WWE3 bacterium]
MQVNQLTSVSAPISVNLEVTDKCNLSCSFCFNAAPSYEAMMQSQEKQDRAEKAQNELLISVRKKRILKTLDRLHETGVLEIRLFGGEFTIFKSWREILEYASTKGFLISFVSNGYLIDGDAADALARNGVAECTISIHGPRDVHDAVVKRIGSFDRAMAAIKYLRESGVVPTVAYTPNRENIDTLEAFIREMCEEYDVMSFSISRLFSDDRYSNLTLDDYYRILEVIDRCHRDLGVEIMLADSFPRCQVPIKYWRYLGYCSQGVTFAQVDFNGNIKNCSATSKILGNVLEEDVTKLWPEKLSGMWRLDHLPKSCKICPIFCGGGCTVSRGVENQFAPDEFIPWPSDESWLQAIAKTVYNRVRKIGHRIFYAQHYAKPESVKELSNTPVVVEYNSRPEGEGHVVMFKNFGVRQLTDQAYEVLRYIDGKRSISEITAIVQKKYNGTSEAEVVEILKS